MRLRCAARRRSCGTEGDRNMWGSLGPTVSAVRTVAMQHTRQARFLLEVHREFAEWISVEAGRARQDPGRFEADIRRQRVADFDGRGGEAAPRGQRLARLRSAWAARGARRIIESMRSPTSPELRTTTRSEQRRHPNAIVDVVAGRDSQWMTPCVGPPPTVCACFFQMVFRHCCDDVGALRRFQHGHRLVWHRCRRCRYCDVAAHRSPTSAR